MTNRTTAMVAAMILLAGATFSAWWFMPPSMIVGGAWPQITPANAWESLGMDHRPSEDLTSEFLDPKRNCPQPAETSEGWGFILTSCYLPLVRATPLEPENDVWLR